MKLKILVSVCFLATTFTNVLAQDTLVKKEIKLLNKNAIYGSIGTDIYDFIAVGYYERIIFQKGKKMRFSPFFRIGLCNRIGSDFEVRYTLPQGGILIGGKKSHFEFAFGWGFSRLSRMKYAEPIASFAYRWQAPNGRFIFRTGIANAEGPFIGIGLSF